jgi:hypothetical protein
VDSGAAYVFLKNGGVWTQQQKLTAFDGSQNDFFGVAVSLSANGSTALIGASGADARGNNSGAAYLFVRSGGVWTFQQKLVPADGASNDGFGHSGALSADGSTALVGSSRGRGALVSDSGAAYVFTRNGGVWDEQAKLTASECREAERER